MKSRLAILGIFLLSLTVLSLSACGASQNEKSAKDLTYEDIPLQTKQSVRKLPEKVLARDNNALLRLIDIARNDPSNEDGRGYTMIDILQKHSPYEIEFMHRQEYAGKKAMTLAGLPYLVGDCHSVSTAYCYDYNVESWKDSGRMFYYGQALIDQGFWPMIKYGETGADLQKFIKAARQIRAQMYGDYVGTKLADLNE
jgi:hypothetical protein